MPHPALPPGPARRAWPRRLLCLLLGAGGAGGALGAASGDGYASQPLAPRAHPPGATMLVALPPEATGVTVVNAYDDPRMWGELYHEFDLGAIGTGIAIGDFDGDGRPDLFVVTKTNGCRLYRNLGGYRFEDVTAKAGVGATPGVWNQGATFVDIDNRGRLDLYVCRYNAPNLLYINQGDGTFREMAHAYGLDLVDASGMAAFCDYDRDGWLDVFIQTNLLHYPDHPNGQRNHLFHRTPHGAFVEVTARAGITGEAHGHSALWWDRDHTGWPDLYVANDFAAPDVLYRNNRDGTFTNVIDQVVPHTPFSSMGSDLGDLRNAGVLDLFATDMASTTHEQDQRGMADSRSRTTEDAAHPEAAPQYERNALYLATGTGRVMEAAQLAGLAATDWSWSPRFEDFDNDGWLDLFITNGMHREQTNLDLIARQSQAESAAERVRVMHDSPVLRQTHLAFRNRGDLKFEDVGRAWGLDQRGVGFGSACADLSGDGNLDIVYANYQGTVTILRNDCATGHVVNVDLRGTASNRSGVGALVKVESALGTQLRTLVLARGYLSNSEPMLHFGLGADTVIARMTITWPSGVVQELRDLPADRRYTITEPAGPPAPAGPAAAPEFTDRTAETGLGFASREETVDETAAEPLLPLRLNRRGPALAVADLEGTGREAIVAGGTTRDALRILFPGQPAASPFPAPAIDDGPILLFDATGGGHADLLVTGGGNALPPGSPDYQPRLYLNDGHGHFSAAPSGMLPALALDAGAVAAADFEHRGRLGLFIGARLQPGQYPLAPRSALLAPRGDHFEDVTDTMAPGLREVGMVTSALWSDVDGDGWPDLLLTLEWGQVRYFHNRHGQGFDDWTERAGFAAAGTGWWTSIATADFNGDGRPDYVVGNVGLNTPYRASPGQPAVLLYGVFGPEGDAPIPVAAYYENGRLLPWNTRRELGAVVPAVLKRYPRNNAYARAGLDDILGPEKIAAAQRFAATQLQSGVFLSQPDGTYRFVPLPRLAQISPLQGIAAGDWDASGHASIYAVQNSFAPIPSVGRFDGGLSQFLRGDGRGSLAVVPPAQSGLVVPGDAKALVVTDRDSSGTPSFVLSRNQGTALVYSATPAPGRHFLSVRLHGPAGNPTAVGARLALTNEAGGTEFAEVAAGSSAYSQSSPACFFGVADGQSASLQILWPDGRRSSATLPAVQSYLVVTEP